MVGQRLQRAKKKAAAVTEAISARSRPEVTAFVSLLLALLFGLALASYDGLGPDGLPTGDNLMGAAGRYAAFLALQILGLSAGYYLVLAVVLGVIWFTESRHEVSTGTLLAYLTAGLLFAALLHLGAGDRTVLGGHQAGGAAGELIGGALGSLFSVWGGRVVALALVVLLIVVATPAPLLSFLRRCGRALRAVGRGFARAARGVASLWRASRAGPAIDEADPGAPHNPAAEASGDNEKRPGAEIAPAACAAEEDAAPGRSAAVAAPAVPPIIHRRALPTAAAAAPRSGAGPSGAAAPPAAKSPALVDIASALATSEEHDVERVIEAARAAGFFDLRPGPSPADVAPAGPGASPAPASAEAGGAARAVDAAAGEAGGAVESPAAGGAAAGPVVIDAPRRKRATRKSGTVVRRDERQAAAYQLPGLEMLSDPPPAGEAVGNEVLQEYAAKLSKTLADYGIEGAVTEIHPGPVVTTYEFRPAPGTKLSRISSLESDVAMAMAVMKVRIVAPIPGKNAVGFEVPNPTRQTVYLKELLADPAFARRGGTLPVAIGKDLTGRPFYSDLAKMPHLLVAGATGTGKSVFVNATLLSLLYRQTPEQMRLLMIDPKHVELIAYDRIPHLLLPVVSDMRKAALALRWAVGEMERRYNLFAAVGARQVSHYNQKVAERAAGAPGASGGAPPAPAGSQVRIVVKGPDGAVREMAPALPRIVPEPDEPLEKLPSIVIVIDELAELMTVAAKDVEGAIQRLAQKGRAAGLHLIVATQRPSVDVITGTIKANFPTRLSFKVSSKTDSRTVLDQNGADQLLGLGDMLLLPPGSSDLLRIQGAYCTEEEIERVVAHIRLQAEPSYDESIVAERDGEGDGEDGEDEDYDENWEQALELVLRIKQASISKIQRALRLGYNRAARIVERMEREGLVGPGSNPREKEIYPEKIIAALGSTGTRGRDDGSERPSVEA